jgi:hypothetical protein
MSSHKRDIVETIDIFTALRGGPSIELYTLAYCTASAPSSNKISDTACNASVEACRLPRYSNCCYLSTKAVSRVLEPPVPPITTFWAPGFTRSAIVDVVVDAGHPDRSCVVRCGLCRLRIPHILSPMCTTHGNIRVLIVVCLIPVLLLRDRLIHSRCHH